MPMISTILRGFFVKGLTTRFDSGAPGKRICGFTTNIWTKTGDLSAGNQMKLPKNGAMTTVSSAVMTRERLAMAPSTSPSSSARTVPKA